MFLGLKWDAGTMRGLRENAAESLVTYFFKHYIIDVKRQGVIGG